ncbi:MAG: hypothetical protein ACFB0G_19475 [Leptolyngbyaceae cyanobacterium]
MGIEGDRRSLETVGAIAVRIKPNSRFLSLQPWLWWDSLALIYRLLMLLGTAVMPWQ